MPFRVTWCCVGLVSLLAGGCAPARMSDSRLLVSDGIDSRIGAGLRPEGVDTRLLTADGIAIDDGVTESEAAAVALWNNAAFQADLTALGFARADLLEAGLLRNPVLSFLFPIGPKQLEATASLPLEVFWQRPRRVALAELNLESIAQGLVQNGLDLGREWRTALISLLAIPMSLIAALMVLHYAGVTINTMVLAGLIIALGEVVDDAIIDVENIVRRLRLNRQSESPSPRSVLF